MSTGSAGAAAVELRSVSKTYALGRTSVAALRGASVAVAAGEMVALTGPSGSGKSTLLNIGGLIDTQDSGEVLLNGQAVDSGTEVERTLLRRDHIGFIFQGFNLVPVMSVEQNIDYPLFIAGVGATERKKRVLEQMEAVGLAAFARHRPDALSGGQRQRVAVARALVKRPSLVIADEPTASLDSATADQILSLMRQQCHQLGSAFLIATHDARTRDKCDRVISILDGAIQ